MNPAYLYDGFVVLLAPSIRIRSSLYYVEDMIIDHFFLKKKAVVHASIASISFNSFSIFVILFSITTQSRNHTVKKNFPLSVHSSKKLVINSIQQIIHTVYAHLLLLILDNILPFLLYKTMSIDLCMYGNNITLSLVLLHSLLSYLPTLSGYNMPTLSRYNMKYILRCNTKMIYCMRRWQPQQRYIVKNKYTSSTKCRVVIENRCCQRACNRPCRVPQSDVTFAMMCMLQDCDVNEQPFYFARLVHGKSCRDGAIF